MILMISIDLSKLFSYFLVKRSRQFFLTGMLLSTLLYKPCIRHYSESDSWRLKTFIFDSFSFFLLGLV